jgi:extradiol dioxygenase family protein
VCHEIKGYSASASANAVDGDPVPVPHMGLAMSKAQFDEVSHQHDTIFLNVNPCTQALRSGTLTTNEQKRFAES